MAILVNKKEYLKGRYERCQEKKEGQNNYQSGGESF
jgi:hypothetical protein